MVNLQPMLRAMRVAGVNPAPLLNPGTAHLVAYGHQIISQKEIAGLDLHSETSAHAIHVSLTVRKGIHIDAPVHLCMGLFEYTGEQNVHMNVLLEEDASATFLAHCLFSRPREASHRMQAEIRLASGACLRYAETHFHGQSGGMMVCPKAIIQLEDKARMFSDFSLVTGRVGQLNINYDVTLGNEAVAEFTSRVHGRANDHIRIRERLVLAGNNARGLIKSRIAAIEDAVAEVIGITEGNAAGARGHVDCLEIVRDRARVSASPLVKVTHPEAKVTHEAAIGSVDHQQLETLMARGLEPDAAVDLIVSGILQTS